MKTMVVIFLGVLTLSGCFVEERDTRDRRDGYGSERVYDPVCGAEVGSRSRWRDGYQGRTYYFHDQDCRNRFRDHPGHYMDNRGRQYDAR